MNKSTQYILIAILSAILVCEIAFVIYKQVNTSTDSRSTSTVQSGAAPSAPSAPSVPSPFSKL